MTRNENQMYSDITSIRKSLEKIANALETNVPTTPKPKDIPGFEGTLDALDVLADIKTITDDYISNRPELEYLKAIKCSEFSSERKAELTKDYTPTSNNPDPAGYGNEDEYETDGTSVGNGKYEDDSYVYETDLQGIRVDSDHDIRSTAAYYEREELDTGATKKDCILDYVTNEFGSHGARYTDIIKFAYYLGAHNAPKYDNSNRGYYACAFNTRLSGHLVQGGKDQLVKGINNEGKERYFALSFVDEATAYWKRIS